MINIFILIFSFYKSLAPYIVPILAIVIPIIYSRHSRNKFCIYLPVVEKIPTAVGVGASIINKIFDIREIFWISNICVSAIKGVTNGQYYFLLENNKDRYTVWEENITKKRLQKLINKIKSKNKNIKIKENFK